MADPTLQFVTESKFRDAAKEKATDNLGVLKGATGDGIIKAIDEKKRTIDFVISTNSVDRMGDTIAVDGWDLRAYKKNPVVLFGHNHGQPPIARGKGLHKKVDDGQLVAKAEFMTKELNEFADMIFQMFVQGFMKATSVGMVPKKWEWATDEEVEKDPSRKWGINFIEQELIEFSTVPVPANSEAIVDARGAGINTAPLAKWASEVLDGWEKHESGLMLTKSAVEGICKDADPKQKKHFRVSAAKKDELRRENLKALMEQAEQKELADLKAKELEQEAVVVADVEATVEVTVDVKDTASADVVLDKVVTEVVTEGVETEEELDPTERDAVEAEESEDTPDSGLEDDVRKETVVDVLLDIAGLSDTLLDAFDKDGPKVFADLTSCRSDKRHMEVIKLSLKELLTALDGPEVSEPVVEVVAAPADVVELDAEEEDILDIDPDEDETVDKDIAEDELDVSEELIADVIKDVLPEIVRLQIRSALGKID